MRRWLIEKLGGYATIDSAIDAVRAMEVHEKHRWLTLAVKRHFNTVSQDDILRQTESGHWLFEGRPLREADMTLLAAEVEQYHKSFLKKVIDRELRYQANKRMFITSAGELDLVAGKVLVFYTAIIDAVLKRVAEKKNKQSISA